MFKAIGNPHRFEVMKFLVTHPGCITGDIVDTAATGAVHRLPTSQSAARGGLDFWRSGRVLPQSYCLHEENIEWFRQKVGEIF